MILFITPNNGFAKGFVQFINEGFDEDVEFVLIGESHINGIVPDEFGNVRIVRSYRSLWTDRESRRLIDESDIIVLSWVDYATLIRLYRYRRKLALWFWGGDIRSLSNWYRSKGPKHLIASFLVHLVENAAYVLTLLPCDYGILKGFTDPKGEWHQAIMWEQRQTDISYGPPDLSLDGKPAVVLLGNSATRTNRHMDAIESLAKFKDDDILVFCPLSYGDMDYAQEVIEAGLGALGDKFVPITEYMTRDEYGDFLKEVSIGVFNNDRQQGLGNIRALIAQGAKVYLSKGSNPAYPDIEAEGIILHPMESIVEEDFATFSSRSPQEVENNMDRGSNQRRAQESLEVWTEVFEMLNGRKRSD